MSTQQTNSKVYRTLAGLIGGLISGLSCGLILVSIELLRSGSGTIGGMSDNSFYLLIGSIGGIIGGIVFGRFYTNPQWKIRGFTSGLIGGAMGVSILLVALLAFVVCPFSAMISQGPKRVARIDMGNGRSLSIYAEVWWEASRRVYYDVWEGQKQIVPREVLNFDLGENQNMTYKVVSAENESLVGVFLSYTSQSLAMKPFIMVDFKTGDWWPRSIDGYEKSKQKETDMFNRLQRENPGLVKPENLSN